MYPCLLKGTTRLNKTGTILDSTIPLFTVLIKKYSSTSYVGIVWAGSKWCPVYKYGTSSEITTAEWCKTLIDKTVSYPTVKHTSRVPLTPLTFKKIKHDNFDFVLSLLSFFSLMHTSKIIKHVLHIKQLLYYQRYSFSGLELHLSYDWQVTTPNTHHSLSDTPFCVYLHTWLEKIQVIYKYSTYRTTVLLLEMSIFWVRAVSKLQFELWFQTHITVSFWYAICV